MTTLRQKILEHRAGFEPANTGFADLRVNRFATDAFRAVVNVRYGLKESDNLPAKTKNPPRLLAGGS